MIKPRRPLSVWLSQILLVVLSVPFWLLTIGTIVRMYREPHRVRLFGGMLLWTVPFILLFAIPFVGLALRKIWARWATAIAFFTAAGLILLVSLLTLPASIRGFTFSQLLIELVLIVIPAFLAFRLTLGKAETDFFVRSSDTYYE